MPSHPKLGHQREAILLNATKQPGDSVWHWQFVWTEGGQTRATALCQNRTAIVCHEAAVARSLAELVGVICPFCAQPLSPMVSPSPVLQRQAPLSALVLMTQDGGNNSKWDYVRLLFSCRRTSLLQGTTGTPPQLYTLVRINRLRTIFEL